ncbi:MAG: hypothetical protein IKU00_01935 [Bacteroidales bacterium]|nr:hypothetical protein [Bacteroidales bacterium]
MKKIVLTITLALIAAFTFAQNNNPVGMRMEVTEITQDNNEYSIFTYKDDDGTFGYYLSLGRVYRILEIIVNDRNSSTLDHISETCLYLGTTADEAYDALEHLLDLLDQEPGTAVDIPCRLTNGSPTLTDSSTATCIVVKRFFQRKRLCFLFTSGRHTAQVDLTRSALKSLRWNLKMAQKLN